MVDSPLSSRSRSPSVSPRGEAPVIFLQSWEGLGGSACWREGRGGGWEWENARLALLCQSFKAQGDTLNNGAPAPAVGAHGTRSCRIFDGNKTDHGREENQTKKRHQRNGRVISEGAPLSSI